MSDTNHSMGGSGDISRGTPKVRMRLFGLVLLIFVATILVLLGVSRSTWIRVDNLQREFTSLQVDHFYWGVRIHGSVLRINDHLLQYRLDGREEDLENFDRESMALQRMLEGFRTNAASGVERDFAEKVWAAFEQYRLEASKIQVKEHLPVKKFFQGRRYSFPEDYEQVHLQSEALLSLCDSYVGQQRSSFDIFLQESDATLKTFQRVLVLSVGLVVALALMLLGLLYRGMIAPLQLQLSRNKEVIARQEKLASLGSLAAGVAHEIRNPLTAIRFRLFSLKKAVPASESESEDVTMIASELDRLERIVNDFLKFARPSEPELVSVPAQRLMREVVDLLRPQLVKERIELEFEESDSLWVHADTQQIKQVLINLIQNAAESIRDGGTITVRVVQERAPNAQRAGLASIEVSDTGPGISKELESRLFDPFFTTKEGGTGLGLPIAARIVEKHGGTIRCRTRKEGGATFSVVLPHVEEHETNHFTH